MRLAPPVPLWHKHYDPSPVENWIRFGLKSIYIIYLYDLYFKHTWDDELHNLIQFRKSYEWLETARLDPNLANQPRSLHGSVTEAHAWRHERCLLQREVTGHSAPGWFRLPGTSQAFS